MKNKRSARSARTTAKNIHISQGGRDLTAQAGLIPVVIFSQRRDCFKDRAQSSAWRHLAVDMVILSVVGIVGGARSRYMLKDETIDITQDLSQNLRYSNQLRILRRSLFTGQDSIREGFAGFPRRTRPWLSDQGQTQGACLVVGNPKMAKSEGAARLGRV